MYNYNNIKSVHLEVTSKCQAKCPMCPRRINGGKLNPDITLDEISLRQFKLWFTVDFIKQLTALSMCGNLGDPIVAQDTLEIFQYLRDTNPNILLTMHTNGSARTAEWWKQLAKINVIVVFGIDGLRDTHSLYRVDTDWDKIIDNAKTFIKAGGFARWDMLIFKHNEDQVYICEQVSKSLGFKDFLTKNTSRFKDGKFDVLDEYGNVVRTLYPTTKSESMIIKIQRSQAETLPFITCKAKEDSQIYVSATGIVSPCCWLDMEWMPKQSWSKQDYDDKIKISPNLKTQTLKEIFDSGFFNTISKCWSTTGLKECSKQCGSFDKLTEQFR